MLTIIFGDKFFFRRLRTFRNQQLSLFTLLNFIKITIALFHKMVLFLDLQKILLFKYFFLDLVLLVTN